MMPPYAQDQRQLDDLKALFDKDPAAGFVEAQRLFEKPERAGDLEGMLRIIGIVKELSGWLHYPAPCLTMAESALSVATARGNWAAVGDIRWAQASAVAGYGVLRAPNVAQMATEAYARAEGEPSGFTSGSRGPWLTLPHSKSTTQRLRQWRPPFQNGCV
jgi:hypothetical protein